MLNAATFVCWKYVRMESKTVAVTLGPWLIRIWTRAIDVVSVR